MVWPGLRSRDRPTSDAAGRGAVVDITTIIIVVVCLIVGGGAAVMSYRR